MKINRLDAHDRLLHLKKEEFDIGKTCQSILDQAPFGEYPFYIFAHKREVGRDERVDMFKRDWTAALQDLSYVRQFASIENVPTHRLIWQPRLTRPLPQDNSMLFHAYPNGDLLEIIWIIPQRELWAQFEKGKMTEDETIWKSIYDFQYNFAKLAERKAEDLTDEEAQEVYKILARDVNRGRFEVFESPPSKPISLV